MRRREFITLFGSAAAWPYVARAQQPAMPVIGFTSNTSTSNARMGVFVQGLKEAGFVDRQNVMVDYQAAEGQPERLKAVLAEFIRRPVAVIVANSVAARAAKNATTTIPIVFTSGNDAVSDGLVASLNRPGGNVTGTSFLAGRLGAKRLGLLRQLVPKATIIGVLMHPDSPETKAERADVQAAAQATGQQLIVLDVNSAADFEPAFTTLAQRGAGAVLMGSGAFIFAHRERLIALAARHAIPAIYTAPEAVTAGGFVSYSASISDAFRQAGIYAGRILRGEKPANLPVIQSTKFEFVINLKTAKTLGLELHPQLLATADELIE